MRHLGWTLLAIVLLCLIIDWFILRAIRNRTSGKTRTTLTLLHASLTVCLTGDIVALACLHVREGNNDTLLTGMWLLFIYLSFYLPKLIFVLFDVVASLPRLWHKRRIKAVSIAGAVLACGAFVACWWGALAGRYRIDVTETTVSTDEIAEAFDGYRIVQFSDIHLGSYGTDTTFVARVVDHINELHPDLIVFTGDIVNRISDEMEPFVHTLSRLKARDGVLAILGNHDYGDYYNWPDESDRDANLDQLCDLMRQSGMTLLTDQSVDIVRDRDTLTVVGVHNISEPQFQTYGSVARAYPHGNRSPKILLSHNPEHWRRDIARREPAEENDFFLTLSGHTHAMQMEVGGVSPASLVYPLWGGLYNDDKGRYLYVNIGLGTVGYPMRIGATPEVSLITLQKKP